MDRSPYAPPNSEMDSIEIESATQGHQLAKVGIILFTGPFWGLLGTVFSMLRAFGTLSENNNADPSALAHNISLALNAILIGLLVGLPGAILILIALLRSKNRERWFYRWAIILSVIWCLLIFPYGMIVGLPIAILFLMKRSEFKTSTGL